MDHLKKNGLLIAVLMASALFLSGCETTLTVRNAAVKDIIPVFKDYVGMQGYTLRYQNDKTGSYNVDMGKVFISGTSSASKTKSVIVQPSDSTTGQPMTAYEQTSWNAANNPAHYDQASAAVSITQRGSDVVIYINTNSAGGTSMNDIKDYIHSLGYEVD